MSNPSDYLKNQRVVVLGGTSGIGLAVAQGAAAEGAEVVVASGQQAHVDEALKTLPPTAQGHALDLANENAIKSFFAQLGAFDHLVFTAGGAWQLTELADMPLVDVHKAFELRYFGALAAVKYAHPQLRPGGSVVLTSGSSGQRPSKGWVAGASVCGAMESLTRALAVELAPLRVNIVAPGTVRTDLWADMPADKREAMYAQRAKQLPVGHVAEPAELAQAYLYLMRETYSTGQVVRVDGGGSLV